MYGSSCWHTHSQVLYDVYCWPCRKVEHLSWSYTMAVQWVDILCWKQLLCILYCQWILGRRHTMSQLLSWTTGVWYHVIFCSTHLYQLLCIENITRLIGSQQDFLNVYPASEIYWLPHGMCIPIISHAMLPLNKHFVIFMLTTENCPDIHFSFVNSMTLV